MRKLLSLLITLSATSAAFAHEGHGHTHGYTITHYFVEPEHALAIAAGLAIVVLLVKRFWKTSVK